MSELRSVICFVPIVTMSPTDCTPAGYINVVQFMCVFYWICHVNESFMLYKYNSTQIMFSSLITVRTNKTILLTFNTSFVAWIKNGLAQTYINQLAVNIALFNRVEYLCSKLVSFRSSSMSSLFILSLVLRVLFYFGGGEIFCLFETASIFYLFWSCELLKIWNDCQCIVNLNRLHFIVFAFDKILGISPKLLMYVNQYM